MQPMEPVTGRTVITAYGDGGFRLGGHVFSGSVLVFPWGVQPWSPVTFDDLDRDAFQAAFERARELDFLLVGTGERQQFLPPALAAHFREAGLTVEVMATGAACRTFNALQGEDRPVGAALIAV
ncbi:Mth938-like domain-containing protein [Phaeovibrio sulfidiphilus]|uniref:Mth938-like domain-containing protein n=1 Tax=Phaeovibrio sulfidiphilus TaxID=1220600 RepID=A0A8J7CD97_9PROT|nr:Mth938-like domain-containing protein [Phaeovibrio sulfidiphilus]MBE1236889.1 Mth938-like domain-containing protein [Phaeovibrio sulfidiphilus]